jgi:hypothetical protein
MVKSKETKMRKLNLILLAMIAALAVGCAKDKNKGGVSSAVPFEPYIPPNGPGLSPGTNWEYGATADLQVTNESLKFYTGWTPNNPTNVRVNINLQKFEPANGTNRPGFGGTVSISFNDSGWNYEDTFSSLVNESHWYGSGMVNNNRENHKYNVWFEKNGNNYWHGFFQDRYGAVIVVIDDNDDQGDGQGPTSVSGSIWVMNFGSTYAPLSPTSCWFVSLGPYDCRTWKSGDAVNTEKDIYPYLENATNGSGSEPKPVGYRKLGDFYNLNFQDAFNGEGQF